MAAGHGQRGLDDARQRGGAAPRWCSGTSRPKPWDSAEAATAIAGKAITAETAEAAGKAAVAAAQPLSQNAYKVTLARVAVKRALLDAAKQKG